jgi:hypothetical protein
MHSILPWSIAFPSGWRIGNIISDGRPISRTRFARTSRHRDHIEPDAYFIVPLWTPSFEALRRSGQSHLCRRGRALVGSADERWLSIFDRHRLVSKAAFRQPSAVGYNVTTLPWHHFMFVDPSIL